MRLPRSSAIDSTVSQFYGYLWRLGRSLLKGKEIQWIMAAGRGGQSIRIVPDLDLVVAITAGYYQDYSPGASQLREDIFRGVLRAASQTS